MKRNFSCSQLIFLFRFQLLTKWNLLLTHCAVNVWQETTITEIKQKIMKIPDANGIVIDGFPRDIGQALSFEDQVCFQKCVAPFQLTACMFLHRNKQVVHSTEHSVYTLYYLLNYCQARTPNRTLMKKRINGRFIRKSRDKKNNTLLHYDTATYLQNVLINVLFWTLEF